MGFNYSPDGVETGNLNQFRERTLLDDVYFSAYTASNILFQDRRVIINRLGRGEQVKTGADFLRLINPTGQIEDEGGEGVILVVLGYSSLSTATLEDWRRVFQRRRILAIVVDTFPYYTEEIISYEVPLALYRNADLLGLINQNI